MSKLPQSQQPLDYQTPETARAAAEERRGIERPVIWVVGSVVAIVLLVLAMLPAYNPRGQQSPRARCASNLKNVAAGLIEYANKNNGHYPDRMEDLFVSTGIPPQLLVCPESPDVPATGTIEEKTAALTAGGHCSYIYMGKALSSDTSPETVLAYEPLGNHFNKGMNVLFGDYHVEFIDVKMAQAMLKSIVPGKPLIWPPGSAATVPTTQVN